MIDHEKLLQNKKISATEIYFFDDAYFFDSSVFIGLYLSFLISEILLRNSMKIDYVFFGPYLSFLDSTPHALLRIKFLCPSVRTSLSSSCVQHACFVVICCLLWTVPRFLHISFSGCLRIVSPIHGTLPPKSFSFAVLRMSFTVLSVSPVHGTLPPDRLLLASTLLLLHLFRGSPDPIYIYVYAKILIRMKSLL